MKIFYEDGPERVSMGAAGDFRRGEPKEVEDTLAEALIKKQTIKFRVVREDSRNDARRKKKEE